MLSLVSDLTRLGLHHQHQGPELTRGAGQGAGHGRDLNIELRCWEQVRSAGGGYVFICHNYHQRMES